MRPNSWRCSHDRRLPTPKQANVRSPRWRGLLFLMPWVWTNAPLLAQARPVRANIPAAMRGTYVVTRNLSERSLGCFDYAHTLALIGLRVTVNERDLLWGHLRSEDIDPQIMALSSNAFEARYGKQPQDLGLPPGRVTLTDVHPSEGIPVNALVPIDAGTILIDACNIWLLAERSTTQP